MGTAIYRLTIHPVFKQGLSLSFLVTYDRSSIPKQFYNLAIEGR